MGPGRARRARPGQIEIAVEATGLNFRDVLWALSMLPEEILEDGFAGPRLGLECAGRVAAVGAGVTAFKPGDRVVAFAQSGFATHIVVPEMVVAAAPQGLSSEAAATTPVAFLTAFYGLVTLARLKAGEWVLVHGGAGGVGLAALQIARMRGARVIATAGSNEKRALVKALGAEHVLDSRSLAFVDDIRRITGDGVDVVLNSLFGEAMERSLNSLKPFGRFVELGKRDYVANTHIGLRPFRRNLSYFGVDLDQLLQFQPDEGKRLFREVMALFTDGSLKALPYQPFAAEEVSDAFRLMQQSGHVGKIVIAPPKAGTIPAETTKPFVVAPDRVHLVTGGLGASASRRRAGSPTGARATSRSSAARRRPANRRSRPSPSSRPAACRSRWNPATSPTGPRSSACWSGWKPRVSSSPASSTARWCCRTA